MMAVLAVVGFVVAAAIGAVLRWRIGAILNATIPWGTLTVNVIGAFLVGVLVGRDHQAAAIIVSGGLGSLTTVSSLAFETHELARTSRAMVATAYLSGTLVLGLAAAWLGLQL